MLYCCLLVRVQPLSLAWADLHHIDSLWALFQGPIVEFRLGYPIFYLGTSKIFPLTTNNLMYGSKYVINTPTWEGCWLQSSLVHRHDQNHETPWLQNPTAYKCSRFFKRKMNWSICLQSQYACEKPLHQAALTFISCDGS